MRGAAFAFSVAGLSLLAATCNASQTCASISSDAQRLACYDMEYRPAPTISKSSKWNVSENVSPMDDSKTVTLHLESSEPIQHRFRGSSTADLYIRCQEKTTSLYFIYADNFLSSLQSYGQVTYRIDDKPSATKSMTESTDNKALGLWSGGSSIPFTKAMFGGNKLTVRITPFNESPITAQFQISGIEDAIQPLRSACGW